MLMQDDESGYCDRPSAFEARLAEAAGSHMADAMYCVLYT